MVLYQVWFDLLDILNRGEFGSCLMEGQLSALKKWTNEHGKVIVKLKTDMGMVKESLLDLKEIKEMLKYLKKKY